MTPGIGQQYDEIAKWWDQQHSKSNYGVRQVQQGLDLAGAGSSALDAGCGAGGRMVRLLQDRGYNVTGIDASKEMIRLAKAHHPDCEFIQADLSAWDTQNRFDVILAWDCLFHLPLDQQEPVLNKLCSLLNDGGVLIYTFGDAVGEHQDEWRGQTFFYSSIGMKRNIEILQNNDVRLRLLELDQFPEKHVFAIAQKP